MSDAARKKPPGMRPVGFFNVTGVLHFCKKWYMIVDASDCSNLPFQFVLMLDKSIEKAGEQT